jgi:hypothetical protein
MIASMLAADRGRITLVAAAGLVLAVLAEACSVGLLGLSGWFIASSAVAGATAYSLFSLMDPSGGVRAFAVGRIVTNYFGRDVLHSAALRRITAARLRFYDRAAARPSTHGAWSGQLLDRVMADADAEGMALIQATTPMVTACAMTAGGCLVFALAGYLRPGLTQAPPCRRPGPRRSPALAAGQLATSRTSASSALASAWFSPLAYSLAAAGLSPSTTTTSDRSCTGCQGATIFSSTASSPPDPSCCSRWPVESGSGGRSEVVAATSAIERSGPPSARS